MESRVRPTLVVGIGEWGAQVVAAFGRRVTRRGGRLPVVRAVAIVADGAEGEETRFFGKNLVSTELEQIRRLDVVQAARRTGWGVEGGLGSGVVLVASLGDDGTGGTVFEVARLLRELSERDFAYRLALSGVLLLPRDAAVGRKDSMCTQWRITADDLRLFDEGCYLLNEVNADGLLVATGGEQAGMVANWLMLQVMTPLQAALDRMPPGEAGRHFDTFGLAAWEFPLEPLTACLAHRWQGDALERLLAPPNDDQRTAVPSAACSTAVLSRFLERHGQVGSPWPQGTPVRFRVAGDAWAAPPFNLVRTLRREIDRAVEVEQRRLRETLRVSEDPKGLELLAVEVDALLDGPGLGAAEGFLITLEETARLRATQSEREVERCDARVSELNQEADEAGRMLDDLTGRFPPWQVHTVPGLVLRPWRLLHLWLLYREIGQQSGVYLACRQSQWLLQAEAHEYRWRATFYTRLAQAASEEKGTVARLRSRLEQLRERLTEGPALGQSLAQRLEAAALPAGLDDYFYRQVAGDGETSLAGLLAIYGPLSRWMREGWEGETLRSILAEHAREQFAFLAEVRLDELLARTYSGTELRRRLATLVDGATPWWACDEPALSAEERAHLCRLVLVGLPDADSSLLVDLLPDRPLSCFSTGDRHQVVVAQVIQGLPLSAPGCRPVIVSDTVGKFWLAGPGGR